MPRSQGKQVGRARIALASLLLVLGVLVNWAPASAWLMPAAEPGPRSNPAPAVDAAPSCDLPEISIAGDVGRGAARLDDPRTGRGERVGARRADRSQPTHHPHNRWWCKQAAGRGDTACPALVLDGPGTLVAGGEGPRAGEPRHDLPPASLTIDIHGPRGPPATLSQLSNAAV